MKHQRFFCVAGSLLVAISTSCKPRSKTARADLTANKMGAEANAGARHCDETAGKMRRDKVVDQLGISRALIQKDSSNREPIEWALMCIRNTTAAYALEYNRDRQLYWLGAAAVAVTEIGNALDKMRDYKMGRAPTPLFNSGFVPSSLAASIADHRLAERLAAGNLAVFRDIFWQYHAVNECGVDALLAMHKYDYTNKQGPADYLSRIPKYIAAWLDHSNGRFRDATLKIARIEQEDILQPILYEGLLPQSFGFLAAPLAEPSIQERDANLDSFIAHVGKNKIAPSISVFASRWSWMNDLLKGMMAYMDSRPEYMTRRVGEIVAKRDKEMEKYPIQNRPAVARSPFEQ